MIIQIRFVEIREQTRARLASNHENGSQGNRRHLRVHVSRGCLVHVTAALDRSDEAATDHETCLVLVRRAVIERVPFTARPTDAVLPSWLQLADRRTDR